MQEPGRLLQEGIGRKDLNQICRRFTLIQRERLQRIEHELLPSQQDIIRLLPLLFHINHPMLPGFVNTTTPAGIPNFSPTKLQLLTAKRISRSFDYQKRARRRFYIQGLYLMGSIGSVAHTLGSDFDVWLCHDPALRQSALESLKIKAKRIESWAQALNLELHIFVMNADRFRRGERETLSYDSSGSTQRRLLLEEFYRTGVLLAGRYPLWWLVPPEEERHYSEYAAMLLHKRFVDPLDCIDFGGLETLSADEFFSAAHWQLFKGIEAPYKTILKLFLTEAYSQEFPAVQWLCQGAKAEIYAGQDNADELDPYVLLYRRLEQYLSGRGESARLELVRRCFYFKTGQKLSRKLADREPSWQQRLMERLSREWQWSQADLSLFDSRESWKIDRVLEERDMLVRELTRSFRLLTDFARTHSEGGSIDTQELSLLGRKLYTALEKRPGKVDSINPGISRDLEESQLSLHYTEDAGETSGWLLYLGEVNHDQAQVATPIKATTGLIELLTWCQLNGIIGPHTRISLYPETCPVTKTELRSLLEALAVCYPRGMYSCAPLAELASQPYALACTLFINVGTDPMAHLSRQGKQLTSNRCDPLSFGAAHVSLVAQIEQLVRTSWGEILLFIHQGETGLLKSLCHYLQLLLFRPAGDLPEVTAHSYSSVRSKGISRRVEELFNQVSRAFSPTGHGLHSRYLLQLSDNHYLIHNSQERFSYIRLSSPEELTDLLAQPLTRFSPLVIDPLTLTESPLPAIYALNRPGIIQLFYFDHKDQTQLYLLDEQGALFQQQLPLTEEYYLLLQQQRFINNICLMRNLQEKEPAHRLLLAAPEFFRLSQTRDGCFIANPSKPPRNRLADDYLELRLLSEGLNLNHASWVLLSGEREFSSLEYGDQLFQQVAEHILAQRQSRQTYPIYLTGLQLSCLSSGSSVSTMQLFNLKRRLEQRLGEALTCLSKGTAKPVNPV
ncbi:MAG: class I adenylate cyclase [Gammaproteobacteria bacterium]|nr:class I adenylate cyclase [Gammaproteobacteria bacterium]